VKPTKQGYP